MNPSITAPVFAALARVVFEAASSRDPDLKQTARDARIALARVPYASFLPTHSFVLLPPASGRKNEEDPTEPFEVIRRELRTTMVSEPRHALH